MPADEAGNVHEHAPGGRRRVERRRGLVERRVAQPLAGEVDAVSKPADGRWDGLHPPVPGPDVLEDHKLDLARDVALLLELEEVLLPGAGRRELDDLAALVDARRAVERRDDARARGQPGEGDVADRVLEVGGGERDGALEGGVGCGVGLVLVPLFFFFLGAFS